MLDLTKPVQTRDGRKVRIIATDRNGGTNDRPVVALVKGAFGDETIITYPLSGRHITKGCDSCLDLVQVPPKLIVRYVNVYRSDVGGLAPGGNLFELKSEAEQGVQTNGRLLTWLGAFPVTITLPPE